MHCRTPAVSAGHEAISMRAQYLADGNTSLSLSSTPVSVKQHYEPEIQPIYLRHYHVGFRTQPCKPHILGPIAYLAGVVIRLLMLCQGDFVTTDGSEYALKEALFTKGPMTVSVDAAPDSFVFYSSGVYNNSACRSDYGGKSLCPEL